MSKMLFPPVQYQCVEEGLHRSGFPSEMNFAFLRSLKLKTMLILDDECPLALMNYLEEEGTTPVFIHTPTANTQIPSPNRNQGNSTVGEEMVTKALRLLMRRKHYPILITCKTGRALTGCVVACLRKLQGWSLISIFEEYRRFSGFRPQQKHEEFIELFDTDLVQAPGEAPHFLTRWHHRVGGD